MDSFCPHEEGLHTLHADLCCDEVVLPSGWEKFLSEFEQKLGEREASELSLVSIDPRL